VAAPDRRAHSLDDHDLAAPEPAVAVLSHQMPPFKVVARPSRLPSKNID
jgi:hypothetical protein